jgi:hypothetical protein
MVSWSAAIMKAMAAPEGTPGYGTLAYGHRDDRT